ncbi:hypothetical protein BRARA_B01216 [Brassica rapa]|uniref:Uncharacterized protein n=1 Tax=Brassica campestris TaxID=3711 RepID=A0A398AEL9_BRACM|nr:hypothetical protein BRARA_B01216 [Brassica rapa]
MCQPPNSQRSSHSLALFLQRIWHRARKAWWVVVLLRISRTRMLIWRKYQLKKCSSS